jgi:glutathione S-transferase
MGSNQAMARRLFNTERSPYGRKIRILLLEKKLAFESVPVDLTQRSAEFVALSPLGKVPVMVEDDGTVLFDSTVIAEYLEDVFPTPPMFGKGVRQRLLHRELDELGDFLADHSVVAFQSRNRGDQDGETQALGRVRSALGEAQRRLESSLWPEEFGVGHAALVSGVGYMAFRHGPDLMAPFPHLRRAVEALAARPSVASTAIPM